MYCRVCGEDNDESSLYCSNDGVALQTSSESFNMVSGDVSFCKECGEEVLKSDLYCSSCGSSLYTIESARGKGMDEVIREASTSSGMDIKNLFKYSLIGVGIILLISIISSRFINNAFVNTIAEEIDFYIDAKVLSFLDVSTLLNVSSLKMEMLSGGKSLLNLNFEGMAFVLILVPLTIFAIMGAVISNISKKKGQKFEWKECLTLALFYGIIIAVLSIFASKKMEINNPYLYEYSEYGSMELVKKYSFISTFIKSTLLSLFSLGLGSGIYGFFSNLKTKRFNALSISSIIFMISSIFTLIVVLFASSGSDVFVEYDGILEFSVLAQVFIYAVLLINMGTFRFMYEGVSMSISLFKNTSEFKDGDIGIQYLYLGLFISMFAFFFYGRNLKKKNKGIQEIVYSPAIFALGLGILAYLTSISANMSSVLDYSFDYMGTATIEFNYLSTAIGSFVICTLSSLAGYFLTNEASGKVKINE